MSLVCHTIVSRYTPQQRDPSGAAGETEADPWQTESSFGSPQRLHSRPAPSFVPASLQYDEYGMPKAADVVRPQLDKSHDSTWDVSTWYRGLTARSSVKLKKANSPPLTASISCPSHQSPGDTPPHSFLSDSPSSQKRNWFTSGLSQVTASHASQPSTLADLLSRNPPPRPSEPTFRPPVFLTIGPSNKGFAMLQRRGWQEGEGLGSARVERKPKEGLGFNKAFEAAFRDHNTEQLKSFSSPSDLDIKPLLSDVNHEVIDLTLSDSESEENASQEVVDLTLSDSDLDDSDTARLLDDNSHSAPHRTTLLTPIATTLKADRLGIGLKAARHSRSIRAKAVTHTSAALAAHIRHGHQARIDRARHGRGSRGLACAKQKEERGRVDLLAYMNSN